MDDSDSLSKKILLDRFTICLCQEPTSPAAYLHGARLLSRLFVDRTQQDLERDPYVVLNKFEHHALVSGIGAIPLLTLLHLVLQSYWIQR